MTPLRLGIIGAENSHSFQIAKLTNVLKKVPFQVTHLWGETREAAEASAAKGEIPNIVQDWRELEGQVDGIMIDHRHGKFHTEPAEFFIARGIPTFVDKPIACDLEEARRILALGAEFNTPVLTFSAKPIQQSFIEFGKTVKENGGAILLNTSGPGDVESSYGGVFFYGIHQVDSVVDLIGVHARSATLQRSGPNAVAIVDFGDGRMATMNFINEGVPGFHWYAQTARESFSLPDTPDELPYLGSARLIHGLLERREVPFTRERMLAPIAILEALARSLQSGQPEKIMPV